MSDPADERILQEYLARKSALSMGYRRVYIEEPPVELDQAITARARRALRWLLPGILATVIAAGLMLGTSYGIGKLVEMMVSAEKTVNRLDKEKKDKAEKERMEAPISVIIDSGSLSPGSSSPRSPSVLSREAWLANIEQLKRTGTAAQVEAEIRRFRAAYPDTPAANK